MSTKTNRSCFFAIALVLAATISTVPVFADCTIELVGTVPGTATKVASVGTLAVVAGGSKNATIVDLSGSLPVARGRITATNPVTAIAVGQVTIVETDSQGVPHPKVVEMIYLVESSNGTGYLESYLATDRDSPELKNQTALFAAGSAAWITTSNNKAILYVGESAGVPPSSTTGIMEAFEISQTDASPSKVAQYSTTAGTSTAPTGVLDFAQTGPNLLLSLGAGGIEIVDISTPQAPQRKSNLAIPGGALAATSGSATGYFYVAAGASGWVTVNANDPSAPSILVTSPTSSPATSISANGLSVVVGLGAAGFEIYQVGSPSAPAIVQSQDTAGSGVEAYFPGTVTGVSLVLVADGANGLVAYDVTYCLCSRSNGTLANKTYRMAVNSTIVYSIDGVSKFWIVDLGSKSPFLRGSVSLGGTPTAITTIFPSKYAYVVESVSGGGKLEVVNATSTSSPIVVTASTVDLPMTPTAIVGSKGNLYVGGVVGSGSTATGLIQIYTVTSQTLLQLVGQVQISGTGSGAGVQGLAISDTTLVAALDASGVAFIDVSAPSSPVRKGTYVPASGTVGAVTAFDKTAFLALGAFGIESVDFTNQDAPAKIASIKPSGSVVNVTAFFGRLAASLGTSGFVLYDTIDPSSFVEMESLDTVGEVTDIAFVPIGPSSASLVIADNSNGLETFDISTCLSGAQVPTAGFSVNPDPIIAGQTATFTDTSADRPTAWSWTFGDGASAATRTVQHTYSSAGVYQVTLTAANIAGSDTFKRYVFVSGTAGNPPIGYSNVWWLPASSRAAGINNTQWTTDLTLFNRSSTTAHALLSFLTNDRDNRANDPMSLVTLGPLATVTIKNVVESNFALTNSSGGIQIAADVSNLLATSRTFNSGGGTGTYGQGIPGVVSGEGLAPGKVVYLIGLTENADFRTNIGFLNGTGNATTVSVTLRDSEGAVLATHAYTLEPLAYKQVSKIFVALGAGEQTNARAEISLTQGSGGPVFVYSSIVDNKSGDPVYQLGVK